MFPISQVQEPYSPVAYLAQRVPLIEMLKLVHPDPDQCGIEEGKGLHGDMAMLEVEVSARALAHDHQKWTAWDVCDGEHAQVGSYNVFFVITSLGNQTRILYSQSSSTQYIPSRYSHSIM